jgi:hypothetical protein
MMSSILTKMGLTASLHDPCLYSGYITSSLGQKFQHPLHIGLYVDDFVFYTKDKAHEQAFQSELAKHIAVDWMGNVDFFLGTAFTWTQLDDGNISVHLSQATFTEHLAHRFSVDTMNKTPNMTPYRSGLPIDSIQPSTPDDPDLARRRKVYQSIVGSINWLANNTRPDFAPVLTFLASYMQLPSHQHYKAPSTSSNISTAQVSMASRITQTQRPLYRPTTIFQTITTKKPTMTPLLRHHRRVCN